MSEYFSKSKTNKYFLISNESVFHKVQIMNILQVLMLDLSNFVSMCVPFSPNTNLVKARVYIDNTYHVLFKAHGKHMELVNKQGHVDLAGVHSRGL